MRISGQSFCGDSPHLRRAELQLSEPRASERRVAEEKVQLAHRADEFDAVEPAAGHAAVVDDDDVVWQCVVGGNRPKRYLLLILKFCERLDEEAAPSADYDGPANVALYELPVDDLPRELGMWLTCEIGEQHVLADVNVLVRDGRPRVEHDP